MTKTQLMDRDGGLRHGTAHSLRTVDRVIFVGALVAVLTISACSDTEAQMAPSPVASEMLDGEISDARSELTHNVGRPAGVVTDEFTLRFTDYTNWEMVKTCCTVVGP